LTLVPSILSAASTIISRRRSTIPFHQDLDSTRPRCRRTRVSRTRWALKLTSLESPRLCCQRQAIITLRVRSSTTATLFLERADALAWSTKGNFLLCQDRSNTTRLWLTPDLNSRSLVSMERVNSAHRPRRVTLSHQDLEHTQCPVH